MDELNLLQRLSVWLIPVLFAITVHETAHGWMAAKLGDPTARMLGRLTLNPIKHIDPLGTILIPGVLLALGGFLFGWAKPVPVTWENLRRPKRDMALVAAAGPISNLLMALFWALVARVVLMLGPEYAAVTIYPLYCAAAGMLINIVLCLLNLLPLPPLDGGRVTAGLLPGKLSWQYGRIEPFGLPILLVLLLTGMLGKILWPLVTLLLVQVAAIGGLSAEGIGLLIATIS